MGQGVKNVITDSAIIVIQKAITLSAEISHLELVMAILIQ